VAERRPTALVLGVWLVLLRTIQDAWGLACLADSCSAGTMDQFIVPG
jgi:hypothetical protein